jgi:diketogulonate reductase-like aldo/keto reductase
MPMPQILYGTAWKKTATAGLVERAIRAGFRGIDTACQPKHYDEAGVGAGIAACLHEGLRRTDLYLQTKFTPLPGQDPRRIPYDPQAPLPEQVAQSVAVSLRNLRTDYIDCLVLHSPLPTPLQTLAVWRCFESLVDTGQVRRLGISNCYALAALERLVRQSRVPPVVLQNRFHAASHYDRTIREFCGRQSIVYQSFWTLTANPEILAHPAVAAVASRRARTAAQIFFRYLTQTGIVPLTGTRSEQHMREDLAIFECDLDPDECRAIEALLRA